MPQLGENFAADAVHRISGEFPASNLLWRVNAWVEQIALALSRDRRTFGNYQASCGALGVVQRRLFSGDVLKSTGACHRAHDKAVLQNQVAQFEIVKRLKVKFPAWNVDVGAISRPSMS